MKKLFALIVAVVLVCCMTGCGNKTLFDTTYSFERAIVRLPNGDLIEGKVTNWKDYEGDQIQVTIDGKTYLVHSSDVVLISE